MTAKDMITALRICGNHESLMHLGCKDCPFWEECKADNRDGSAMLLEAANVIEELMKELARARDGAE